MKKTYKVIGLMSGSSLDGVDVAYCEISEENGVWGFEIKAAECFSYPEKWYNRLFHLSEQSALTFFKTHTYYGYYLGEIVNHFIEKHDLKPQLIASHGHTIFHEPQSGFSCQIGCGNAISATTGITTVSNFRAVDIGLGGQGAPIVPIGDKLLFGDYKFCLNIGGIANISCKMTDGSMLAFDCAGANQILNFLANEMDKDFDEGGELARSGEIDENLLEMLNKIDFYKIPPPKSLSNAWVKKTYLDILLNSDISITDKLRTFTEHLAYRIGKDIKNLYKKDKTQPQKLHKMLVSGGGAFNHFLIEKIQGNCEIEVVVPSKIVVEYKEALVMALMGVLRIRQENNVLVSVTGAERDNCGGEVAF